ncbi:LytTR family transcriptional regulator DNA-binding domain-containing protein [Microscilla marina]|uniref:Adenylate cyclase Cya3 n=1 Tax=Microscilla marina ATCC 23134 TaxID=313606 RepID=A1ZY11_MICM2|nr:LytTR family transcriptional regulator DNA-binding domain-containing protein [Microscilla marina]EAY24748.1 adenylate cyclase; Cya3 [Microscilla marina ATCC 23134]
MISPNSVAVLPFTNMSGHIDNEYFSDGITEEIINRLAQVQGIYVTARTSSFSFQGKNLDVRQIGKKLNVAYILEGSVRRAGNKVRIAAQLVNTQQGFHEFSEVYDRDLQDVLGVQDEIALLIANKLKDELINLPLKMPFTTSYPKNAQAYDWYLQANHILYNCTPQDFPKAEKLYQKITEIEPDYAPAYSGLARCFLYYAAIQAFPPKEAFAKAKAYALKALELDSTLIDGHISYLGCTFWQNWDIDTALLHINKTIQKIPGSAEIHAGHAMLLLVNERFEEALASMKLAIQLDPFSPHVRHRAGVAYYCMERYHEAIAEFFQELDIAGRNDTQFKIAWCKIFLGQYDEALEILNATEEHPHQIIAHDTAKGYLYAQAGNVAQAKFWLDKALEKIHRKEIHFGEYNAAIVYMLRKDETKLWQVLEHTLNNKVPVALFTPVDPLWQPIKDDPRFKKLIAKNLRSNTTEIQTNTQEGFQIDLTQILYAEAEDNYCHLVYFGAKGTVKQKLLRLPLKDLETQLDQDTFIRTHRSFIVNLHHEWQLAGKSKHYYFKLPMLKKTVPLARSKEKKVLEKFKSRVV